MSASPLAHDLAAALDPVLTARRVGMEPDGWQAGVLRSTSRRQLLNCCRQAGKSTTVSVKAVHRAVYTPGSLVVIISPGQRQSDELYAKCRAVYRQLGRPVPAAGESASELRLENESRIVSLPGTEGTTRGLSGVDLLVIDEASRVADEIYTAVLPMVGVSGGSVLALSTPHGARGWWHKAWVEGGSTWDRVKITAPDVPRLTPGFLDEARAQLGSWLFKQEYLGEFVDTVDQIFPGHMIEAAFGAGFGPLFATSEESA